MPCSISRIIAVAANVFEIDAIGKTVCAVTGSESSNVRDAEPLGWCHDAVDDDAERDARHAELLHLRLGERDERVEARVGAGLRAEVAVDRADAQNDRDGETR